MAVGTSEGLAFDGGVELITPPETARLAGPPRNSSGDQAPIPRPELAHDLAQYCVFFRRPRSPNSITTVTVYTAINDGVREW